MIARDTIQALIAAGSYAPSGDNSQPWCFRVKDQEIFVLQIPNKDNPFLNYEQGGTLIACGAVIENIVIEASAHNIGCTIELFPGETNCVAKITLTEAQTVPDPLRDTITRRHTNRHNYRAEPLTPDLSDALQRVRMDKEGMSIVIKTDEAMKELAYAGSRAEIAILENQELHTLLFDNVVWTAKEEEEKKSGLFVKTLEFAPPQEFVFSLCRKWTFMQRLNKFGFAKFIANDDAKKYATGAAYIAIVAETLSGESFVNAGRMMQRIWLEANKHEFAVHPITATLFFGHRILGGRENGLTEDAWELMRKAFAQVRQVLGVSSEQHVLFMMRVGKAKPVRFRSSKKSPIIAFE